MKFMYIYIFFIISSNCYADKNYFLSICALLTDEKNDLDKWIEYHENLGVDHFFLYYSDIYQLSNQTIKKSLEGTIDLINWPKMPTILRKIPVGKISAYEHARNCFAKNETKWLICLDTDEYLFPLKKNLRTLLEENKKASSLEISCIHHAENTSLDSSKTFFRPKDTTTFTMAPYKYQYKNDAKSVDLEKASLDIQYYKKQAPFVYKQENFLPKTRYKLEISLQNTSEKEVN